MFNLTFTTRRRLRRLGIAAGIAVMLVILIWVCWVIWIGRYVVFSGEGAKIDMSLPQHVTGGQLSRPPSAAETVPVYVNEGSDAITTASELSQINGYYVDTDMLQHEMDTVMNAIATLPAGTAVMVELKNIWGTFFYSSDLADATVSSKLDPATVDKLITELNSKNLYCVAQIPAFRERYYLLNHSSAGLEVTRRTHLWEDKEKCYWMDPTDNSALNWVMSIVEELKALGFDEVVFTEFRMPDTDGIYFNGDEAEAIRAAAEKIAAECGSENFAVSFMTDDPDFPLPENGRCRVYLQNISAKEVAATAARLGVADQKVNIVFLANTNDTRYDEFSCLRPMTLLAAQ